MFNIENGIRYSPDKSGGDVVDENGDFFNYLRIPSKGHSDETGKLKPGLEFEEIDNKLTAVATRAAIKSELDGESKSSVATFIINSLRVLVERFPGNWLHIRNKVDDGLFNGYIDREKKD